MDVEVQMIKEELQFEESTVNVKTESADEDISTYGVYQNNKILRSTIKEDSDDKEMWEANIHTEEEKVVLEVNEESSSDEMHEGSLSKIKMEVLMLKSENENSKTGSAKNLEESNDDDDDEEDMWGKNINVKKEKVLLEIKEKSSSDDNSEDSLPEIKTEELMLKSESEDDSNKTGKESNNLIAELFECTEFYSDQNSDEKKTDGFDNSQLMDKDNLVKEEPIMINENQVLLLAQQMRQFVQILTQNFLLTYQHPEFHHYSPQAKEYLLNLKYMCFEKQRSAFYTVNLNNAVKLVEEWESLLASNNEDVQSMKLHIDKTITESFHCKKNGNQYIHTFPTLILKTIANSDVFLYTSILPLIPFRSPRLYSSKVVSYTNSEDHLIAFGLEEFESFLYDSKKVVSRYRETHAKLISSYIQQYMLTFKSAEKIKGHIYKCKNHRCADNPIKYYFHFKKAPAIVHYISTFDQMQILPPCKRQPCDLPTQWRNFIYPNIPKETDSKWDMKWDMKVHSMISSLDKHDKNSINKYDCDQCDYRAHIKMNLIGHIRAKRDKNSINKYDCDKCDYSTHFKSDLKPHIIAKHNKNLINKYDCDHCDYSTHFKGHLKVHVMAKHDKNSIKKYGCDYCDYRTHFNSSLKKHIMAKHDKNSLKFCDQCDYRTHMKIYLKNHIMAKHNKNLINKYDCDHCDYSTHFKRRLKDHVMAKHDKNSIKKYGCDYCDYRTHFNSSLKKHIMAKHDKNSLKFGCDQCDYRTHMKIYLKNHIMAKHKKNSINKYDAIDATTGPI